MTFKLFPILLFLSALFFITNCGTDSGGAGAINIKASNVSASDFGNSGNASDIRISFVKPGELPGVGNFRIIVAKSSSAGALDAEAASLLAAGRYVEINKNALATGIDLPASLNDTEGDAIQEGVTYQVFVLSVGINTDDQLSNASPQFTLEQVNLVKTLVLEVDGGSGGMAVDADGNIYMADFGQTLQGPPGNKIFKITPGGSVSIFATGFIGASGNDFNSQGNLFQSNIQGQSISKVSPDGTVSTFASGPPISGTVGISIDNNDELFVADCTGNQLLKIDTSGNVSVYSTSTLYNCPNGITRDESDNLYVANFSDDRILKITPPKEVSVLATLPHGNTASGNNGHITYHDGFLYAVARSANQIFKISLDGETELFAGAGARGSKDGSALQATFSLPNDLIFSNDGTRLYLNDVVPLNGNDIAPCNIRVIEIVE